MSLSEDALMNKLLKQLHPYKIFFSEKENRWRTTIEDTTKVSGRRTVARQNRIDLEKFLLEHYHVQLNTELEETEQSKTFKEVFDIVEEKKLQYIKTPEKLLSAKNTAIKNNSDYRRYFSNTDFENIPVNKITKNEIEEICLHNLKRYNMKKKSFLSLRGILKAVFDYAYSEYWIEDNVYHRVQFKKFHDMLIPETPTSKRVHSSDEFTLFLHELHSKQKNRPKCSSYWALELQMLAGMRRGELPPLRWGIDVTEEYIHICREQLTTSEGHEIVEHTKNHRDRYFPITDDLKNFLTRLKAMHDIYYPDSDYLFPAENKNGTITNRAVYCVYEKICKKLGIKKEEGIILGPHSFRRNAITDVVNATNGNIILASALFGNSPEVAKQNYYTGVNLAITKEILNQRQLLTN